MINVKVLFPININGGKVRLSDEQVSRRARSLRKSGRRGSVYEVLKPISFKVGEVIGIEEISKIHKDHVEILKDCI